MTLSLRKLLAANNHLNCAILGGELEGIWEEVYKDLLEPVFVPEDVLEELCLLLLEGDFGRNFLLLWQKFKRLEGGLDGLAQVEVVLVELEGKLLLLGQVE